MRFHLGNFPVVESKLGGITLNIGKNVHITIHSGLPHSIPEGTLLPLFTEVPDAYLRPVDSQPSSEAPPDR
jgi:hypothetical protein